MSNQRHNQHPDRTPIQQSMTVNPTSYVGLNLHRLMLGIVLEVFPADHPRNRSAQQSEVRRGFLHEATVLVLQDGSSTYMTLEHVVITPDSVSGLDDFVEKLPRGCTALTTGEVYNASMSRVNPADLDGDWCVIGFLGGSLDKPFILRWWPHPKNVLDPATSGNGNPNSSGQGQALTQTARYLRRINGVECVINGQGDILISTVRSNSSLRFGAPPEAGRLARLGDTEEGGSVKLTIKPSQALELTWNTEEDGIGVLDRADTDLPQTNPRPTPASGSGARTSTYARLDSTSVEVIVPEDLILTSRQRIRVTADSDTTITIGGGLTSRVTGNTSLQFTGVVDLVGQSSVNVAAASISLAAGGAGGTSVGISPTTVDLGGAGGLPLVNNSWISTWATALAALSTTVAAAPPVPTPASNLVLITAIQTALNSMNAALASAITTKTKAL